MHELAIYGKGGIGKSTMAANLSAVLAEKGTRVLQIGCDPKHDSTRNLTGGRAVPTVLDYIKTTAPPDCRLEDILVEGYRGIGCIEAGGPEPGVGCAGRGIITAFKLLDSFSVLSRYDLAIYDVLGDVVCGGFAVPVRREYSDTVVLVTSGEYMAIYAANNILRGIRNYDAGRPGRIAGIIYNARNLPDEDARVEAFADAVGIPILAKIPRDEAFARAERRRMTLLQMKEEGACDKDADKILGLFRGVADHLLSEPDLYPALPLSDEKLEGTIMGWDGIPAPTEKAVSEAASAHDAAEGTPDLGYLSKNVYRDEPLHGCAFNGASNVCVNILDAVVVMHAPRNCSYLSLQTISSTGRRCLFERGTLLPASLAPNIISTDMTDSDMVFGGTEKLMARVREIVSQDPSRRPRAVIVVSACAPGIIGDDIRQAGELSTEETPVITIRTDGNLSGDYLQGMIDAYTQIAEQVIDPDVECEPDTVNIVFEKTTTRNMRQNFETVRGFLDRMGIRVNCRFLCETTLDQVRGFKRASLNLLAYRDYTGKLLEDFFRSRYGCRFLKRQFPVGFQQTAEWLREVGAFFGREDVAEQIISENSEAYRLEMERLRPQLEGKRLMIVTFTYNLDWILGPALDAGMEVVKICLMNFSQDEGFTTNIPEVAGIEREELYDPAKREDDIDRLHPDILLVNYESDTGRGKCLVKCIPYIPNVGFFSGVDLMQNWADSLRSTSQGAWMRDRELYERYLER